MQGSMDDNTNSDVTLKIRMQMLLEDRKRANAVRAKVSTELLEVLLMMKEHMKELRDSRPDLAEELRGRGLIYESLYAKPYDRLCEIRNDMLQRFTQVYNDLETLSKSEKDNDELALQALQPISEDLLEVLHIMIDGMSNIREYRSDLGRDIIGGGVIYEQLYNSIFSRISVIRDSLPILMNAVFGRRIFRR